ncbi:hypothetical protein LCGC14_2809660 [marine sediment metagenome]|uniref:Minor tail T domain-containing protein n=1 Tax=marine sediment metagenome TaxID=412755 RepID=A0A0F8YK91_9ZZZZ
MAGTWDVDGLLEEIPAPLFMEWQEYASFRPIGDRAADARMASLLCMVANMMSKRGSPRRKLEDFMISREPTVKKRQTAQDIEAVMQAAYNKQEEAKHGKRRINGRS